MKVLDERDNVKPDSTETNGVRKSSSETGKREPSSPTVNGGSPTVNGGSPAVNGDSAAVNGAIASGFNGNARLSLLKESEEKLLENGSPCLPGQPSELFSHSREKCDQLEMLCNNELDTAAMYGVFETAFNKQRLPAHVNEEPSASGQSSTELRMLFNGYSGAVTANSVLPAKSQEAQDARDFTTRTESTLAQGAKPTSLLLFTAALLRGIKDFVPRAVTPKVQEAEAAVAPIVQQAEAAVIPKVQRAEVTAPRDDRRNTAFEDPRDQGEDLIIASSLDSNTALSVPYEFEIRQSDCGRLFGRNGYFIKSLTEQTQVCCVAYNHPYDASLKMVSLRGTGSQVTTALGLIRRRFPINRYPELTLQRSFTTHPEQCVLPLSSPACIIVCSVMDPIHFFVQQVSHHSIHALADMTLEMSAFYNGQVTPGIQTLQTGIICVSPVNINDQTRWYRSMVVAVDEAGLMCTIKYLDYGGYANVHCSMIRQIAGVFLSLQFLASECILGGIAPVGEDWSPESKLVFETLTRNKVLTCEVWDSTPDGISVVNLYNPGNCSFISVELIKAQLARPIALPPCETVQESAYQSQEPVVFQDDHGAAAGQVHSGESSVADEVHGAESSVAEEDHSTESSVADEVHGAESSVADEVHGAESSVADEVHGAESSVADEVHGAESSVADEDHSAESSVADDVPDAESSVADEIQSLLQLARL